VGQQCPAPTTYALTDDKALHALPGPLTGAMINSRLCCASSVYTPVFFVCLGPSAGPALCNARRVCEDERAAAVHNSTHMRTRSHPLLPFGKVTVLHVYNIRMLMSLTRTACVCAGCLFIYHYWSGKRTLHLQLTCSVLVACAPSGWFVLVVLVVRIVAVCCLAVPARGCPQALAQPFYCCFTTVARMYCTGASPSAEDLGR
jgi:hypothetical protein